MMLSTTPAYVGGGGPPTYTPPWVPGFAFSCALSSHWTDDFGVCPLSRSLGNTLELITGHFIASHKEQPKFKLKLIKMTSKMLVLMLIYYRFMLLLRLHRAVLDAFPLSFLTLDAFIDKIIFSGCQQVEK